MTTDDRIRNETRHGEYIGEHGEELWNWSSPAGRLRWERRCGLFREFLGDGRKRVLEIGCGTGLFTKELASTCHMIVAIDISATLLRKAKERISAGNVHFVVGNAYETEFQSASFDCIVGSSSLHHLDVDAALQEFGRVLRPGGGMMFTEPNMMNPQVALTKNLPFLKRRVGDSPDETAFFRWRIAEKLRRHGFRDVSAEPFDFVHPALPAPVLSAAGRCTRILEGIPLVREIAGSLLIRCRR